MAWGSHLASRSNQDNPLHILIGITCGVDVELRPETKRSCGDVGRNSKSDILLGRSEWLLGLFAEEVFHLCRRGWEKTEVVDLQSQSLNVVMELYRSTAV